MKKTLQKIALGAVLFAAGAGIATPIAYNAAKNQDNYSARVSGYDAGAKAGHDAGSREMLDKCYDYISEGAETQRRISKREDLKEDSKYFETRGHILDAYAEMMKFSLD